MPDCTLVIPYYRQPEMLRRQLDVVSGYPRGVQVVVVDDGSPEPAADVITADDAVELYRIDIDIPWNRGGARNLGARVARSAWLVHVDVDHILPAPAAIALQAWKPNPRHWYRFPRYRVGRADETRRKDSIADDVTFGEIKPHMDSYLCARDLYWRAGGYDEDYSGCLGGGTPFTQLLQKVGGAARILPPQIMLHVYTRDVVPDASVSTLSRDTTEYKRRKLRKGIVKGRNPIRFPWHRVQ